MQRTVSQSTRIDDATADALLAAIEPVETLPDSIANSMVAEWQIHASLMKQASENPMRSINFGADRNFYERAIDRIAAWTFDPNDTLNAFAKASRATQAALRKTAQGAVPLDAPTDTPALGCSVAGDWAMACLPFQRNPVGRILPAIAMPAYEGYGVRVADLRNLAAATRLTVEARRRGLAGDALAQFVSAAPSKLREVFDAKTFAYDPAARQLRLKLRERSSILGEKDTAYSLPL